MVKILWKNTWHENFQVDPSIIYLKSAHGGYCALRAHCVYILNLKFNTKKFEKKPVSNVFATNFNTPNLGFQWKNIALFNATIIKSRDQEHTQDFCLGTS